MLKILISYFLGPFGMRVEEWYIANSLYVNSLIVLYGLLLVVSNLNYKKILDSALSLMNEGGKKYSEKDLWIKSIQAGSFFPLISGNLHLYPKKTGVPAILSLIKKDKRWQKIVNTKKKKNSPKKK